MTNGSKDFFIAVGFCLLAILILVISYALYLLFSSSKLRETEGFLAKVVSLSPACLIVFANSRVINFNKGSELLHGYSSKDAIGKRIDELPFLPEILKGGEDVLGHVGRRPLSTTERIRLDDGSIRTIQWQIKHFEKNSTTTRAITIASGLDVTALTDAQAKLKALSARLSATEQRERRRIGEELHDSLAEISILSMRQISELREQLSPLEKTDALDKLSVTVNEFIKRTRSLLFELIPPALYDIGLSIAVESLATSFSKQHNLDVRVLDDTLELELHSDLSVFVYKAIREFLLNVVKHSQGSKIWIKLQCHDNVFQVSVIDDGIGYQVRPVLNAEGGFGLFNIKSQAEYYGGDLSIGAVSGRGCQVILRVPIINLQDGIEN